MENQNTEKNKIKPPNWENVVKEQQPFLLKEIDVIHNQISKYDEYSLIIKGWAITLWTALLFAISQNPNEIKINMLCLSIGCLFAFWIIDAYFKYFQRLFIARSNLISDYLNKKLPKNGNDFIFRIYDPIGRISRNLKEFGENKKEKKKNNFYRKNYIKRWVFFRCAVVRVVSNLYCVLIGITMIYMNVIDPTLIIGWFSIIPFIGLVVSFIFSQLEKI